MSNISWTKEQEQAIYQDNTNIIVSAGAGSGKTAVLTTRIIRKLKQGIKANQLLVLTFSVLAAEEMKSRVIKKMQEDDELKIRIPEVENAQISTFDSFASYVVKKYHYLLGVSKNFQNIDSNFVYLKCIEMLNNIFASYYQEKHPLFLEMIDYFTTKDDQALIKTLAQIYCFKINQRIDKEDFFKNYTQNYCSEKQLEQYLNDLWNLIYEKKKLFEDAFNDLYEYLVEKKLFDKVESCKTICNATNYDELYIALATYKALGIKPKEELYKQCSNQIKNAIEEMKKICVFPSLTHIRNTFFNSAKYQELIIEILKKLDNQIQVFKRSYDVYEFADVSKFALEIVKNHPSICDELRQQYKEILIDEYQDTNDSQETFISYIANNNVCVVGDVKQSIYRFRNANPEIFINKYNNYSQGNGGIKIDLTNNFRSNRDVINTINQIFSKLMTGDIGGANYVKGHQMQYGFTTYDSYKSDNNIKYITYSNKDKKYSNVDIEIFYVVHDILETIKSKKQVYDPELKKTRDCTFKDFSILLEKTKYISKIQKLLEYYNIPTAVLKNEDLKDGELFSVFLNVLNAINRIHNNNYDSLFMQSYYGLGRSFIFEYPDNQLFFEIKNKNYEQTILFEKLLNLAKKINILTNEQFIHEIVDTFNLYENIIKIGNIDTNLLRINYFVSLAKTLDNIHVSILEMGSYLQAFIDEDKDIQISSSPATGNSVKIMTIHKSKGLEFPVCYFMLNFSKPNTDEIKSKFMYHEKYGIITPFYDDGIGETITKFFAKQNYIKELISEKIRLFYVALTRCRESMVILNQQKKPNEKPLENCQRFMDFLHYVENDFTPVELDVDSLGIHYKYLNQKETILSETDLVSSITHHNISLSNHSLQKKEASKQVLKILSTHEKKVMSVGTKYHEIFEWCDFKNFNRDNYSSEEANKLCNFLEQPLLKNIKNATIYKEMPFVYQTNSTITHGVIDLILEYDDHVDIIDYKLKHTDDDAYLNQLGVYKNYVYSILKKPVFTYLYSIMENKMVAINI